MAPRKVGSSWIVGKKHISLYELYLVWGGYKKVRPKDMTAALVKQYLAAKTNKQPPFGTNK